MNSSLIIMRPRKKIEDREVKNTLKIQEQMCDARWVCVLARWVVGAHMRVILFVPNRSCKACTNCFMLTIGQVLAHLIYHDSCFCFQLVSLMCMCLYICSLLCFVLTELFFLSPQCFLDIYETFLLALRCFNRAWSARSHSFWRMNK